jgi:hypothetical protein
VAVFAFGIGLVFGYSFDTTGPVVRDRTAVAGAGAGATTTRRRRLLGRRADTHGDGIPDRDADAPLAADREADVPPREREPVGTTTTRSTDRD